MVARPRLPHRRSGSLRRSATGAGRILPMLAAGAIFLTSPTGLFPRAQELAAGESQVYVAVLRGDRPVMGLGPADFRIEEDGDRREVLRVEPATIAYDLALLVDDSMVADSNIVHIREALVSFLEAMRGNRISLRAGSGIVADSDPVAELAETRAKAKGLLEALSACAASHEPLVSDDG